MPLPPWLSTMPGICLTMQAAAGGMGASGRCARGAAVCARTAREMGGFGAARAGSRRRARHRAELGARDTAGRAYLHAQLLLKAGRRPPQQAPPRTSFVHGIALMNVPRAQLPGTSTCADGPARAARAV